MICKSQIWEITVELLKHEGSSMTLDEGAPPSVGSTTLHLTAVSFLLFGVHWHHFLFESGVQLSQKSEWTRIRVIYLFIYFLNTENM